MRVLGNNRGPSPWAGSAQHRGVSQSRKRFVIPDGDAVVRELSANLPVLRWRHW